MKLLNGIFIVALLALLFVTPVLAQDAPASPSVVDEFSGLERYEQIVVVLGVLLGGVLVAFNLFAWIVTGRVYHAIPAETLEKFLPAARFAGDIVARTDTLVDDRAFEDAMGKIGYSLVKNDDGTYIIKLPTNPLE